LPLRGIPKVILGAIHLLRAEEFGRDENSDRGNFFVVEAEQLQ
jgi:hypothetical protein